MADTAIKNEEEKKEYFDSPQVLKEKVQKLAMYVLSAEHFCAFTGAGISTSSGIPDLTNEQHLIKLWDILKEHNWNIDARVELLKNLNEISIQT